MPLLQMSVKHGRTLDDARSRLESAVAEVQSRFGALVRRVSWAADRTAVSVEGVGFVAELRVDSESVHVAGDFPALGALLGRPFEAGLKQIVQQKFGAG